MMMMMIYATTVIEIISNRFFFCFESLFKNAHYFNYNSFKSLQLEIVLSQFRSFFSPKFLGIKVTSLPVSNHMGKKIYHSALFLSGLITFIAYVSTFSVRGSVP